MGTGQLFAGNLVSLLVSILAFLQVLPWAIAGYLIIGTALLVTIASLRSSNRVGSTMRQAVTFPERSMRQVSTFEGPSQKKVEDQATRVRSSISFPTQSVIEESVRDPVISIEKKPDDSNQIGEGDYVSFEVKLKKGEHVEGEVTSNGDVNAYILNDENLAALESDQEFWYEAGSEGIQNTVLRFTAPEDGEWYFVVENAETKEVSAKIRINVAPPSHQFSALKTEGLDLPDARLEGKLQ
jgi:hypothetical protein